MNVTRRFTPPVVLKPRNVWALLSDKSDEVTGTAGDDTRDRTCAFDAFCGDLLLPLAPDHKQLRRIHPERSGRSTLEQVPVR
jgi:hypothetical protein